MTKREKILIGVTIVATGASVFMFAFVSLAHFLKTAPQTPPALISHLYENTIDQLATLEPVPVEAIAPPVETKTAAVEEEHTAFTVSQNPKRPSLKETVTVNNKKDYVDLQRTVESASPETVALVNKVLKDVGLNPGILKIRL